jgi:hypothetical protein
MSSKTTFSSCPEGNDCPSACQNPKGRWLGKEVKYDGRFFSLKILFPVETLIVLTRLPGLQVDYPTSDSMSSQIYSPTSNPSANPTTAPASTVQCLQHLQPPTQRRTVNPTQVPPAVNSPTHTVASTITLQGVLHLQLPTKYQTHRAIPISAIASLVSCKVTHLSFVQDAE